MHLHFGHFSKSYQYDNVATDDAIHKVLDILNSAEKMEVALPLPGFGKSPIGRQLRITDLPFPLKDEFEGDDRAANQNAAERQRIQ